MKYIQTGFQHLIQRIDTSKCKLEFTVPVRISVKGLLYLVEDLRKRKGSLNVKDPAAFGKAGKITGAHHYKCDVLVSQEAFGKRIAQDKGSMASAGLLPDICEDHPASGGLHGRGWKHPLFSPQNRQQ